MADMSRAQYIMAGKAWDQEQGTPSRIESIVTKKRTGSGAEQ